MAPLRDDAPVGIYIHIPFCRHICPYCDFNTYRGLDALIPRYVDALVRDIESSRDAGSELPAIPTAAPGSAPREEPPVLQPNEHGGPAPRRPDRSGGTSPVRGAADESSTWNAPSRRPDRSGGTSSELTGHNVSSHLRPSPSTPCLSARTVYLGGGTPSLLTPEQISRILTACRNAFALDPAAEITLEANPNGVDAAWFAAVRETGVNRLSIGAQTFDRKGLRVLGRQHEASDVFEAIAAARAAGFDNVSLDLIFGWPGQSLPIWRADLETLMALPGGPPEHCSLYSLIVEPGTPMADAVARGVLTVVDDDAAADLYESAMATLAGAGWTHYEIANWARSPRYASRHNLVYWRNGAYAAFGAGAHGRLGNERFMNHLKPLTWIEAVEAGASTHSNTEYLPPELQMGETMMLGLRLLNEGVTAAEFETRHGVPLYERFGPQIAELASLGLLTWDGSRLRLAPRGALLANDVCARFL